MRLALALLVALAVPTSAAASTVKVDGSRYGDILVDGKGRTLYLFTKERTRKSRCYGDCATAWPPFLTKGKPHAGKGTDPGRVGSTKRKNGKRQVTYNGHPLYFYIADRKAGQITCQNVVEFGGTWLLVAPNGSAIH
jgi:predicted lipoprotein with Yx(FWY)xxD motif